MDLTSNPWTQTNQRNIIAPLLSSPIAHATFRLRRRRVFHLFWFSSLCCCADGRIASNSTRSLLLSPPRPSQTQTRRIFPGMGPGMGAPNMGGRGMPPGGPGWGGAPGMGRGPGPGMGMGRGMGMNQGRL